MLKLFQRNKENADTKYEEIATHNTVEEIDFSKLEVDLDEELTIVYPPTVDWFFLYQRPQQLMTAWSNHPKVRCIFFSNEAYKKLPRPITKMNDSLYLVRAGQRIEHLFKGKTLLWISYPPHHYYIDTFKFDYVVFDAIDNPVEEFEAWQNGLGKIVSRADMVSSSAKIMMDWHQEQHDKPVFMCPNGADFEHFKVACLPLPKPGDYPRFKPGEKVVGFYGAMASWVDWDIIKKIASKYKVVLIGNNKFYKTNIKHPNIVVLDHKDYRHLPLYLSQFDVTMVPFKLTEMIKGCDPIKYYEFLSAGKPVLATRMPELEKYEDVTYFIDHDNCIEMVDKALAEDSQEKKMARMEVAKANSWQARANKALHMVKTHLMEV